MIILLGVLGISVVLAFIPRPVEKAVRKPVFSQYAVEDPAFLRSVGELSGAPLSPGNRVSALLNGDQIFPAQLEAIRNAKRTITLENFIFRSGQLSGRFISALSERARAGVKVHIIMDSMGCAKLEQKELDQLKEAGAQFIKYNRTEWHKLLRVNHRDHRKLLVTDGRVGFTGGACLADEWLGNADNPKVWRDTHFEVHGPIVSQMQGVFMENWLQTQHEVLHGPEYFPELERAGSAHVQCFATGPAEGMERARLVYLLSVAAARKSIRIAHSYFVPDDMMIEALLAARKRGVKIEIITPGIIDANVVRRASRSRWDELLTAGCEFYEYQPALYHCKVVVVDDVWVLAGTGNFDNRSFRINDENTLNVWDKEFATAQVRTFEADKTKSRRIRTGEFKARPWYVKAAEEFAGFFRAWL